MPEAGNSGQRDVPPVQQMTSLPRVAVSNPSSAHAIQLRDLACITNALLCRVEVGRIAGGLNRRRRYRHVEMRAGEAGRRGCSRRRSVGLVSITVRGLVAAAACVCPLWAASGWRSVMKPRNRTIWSLLPRMAVAVRDLWSSI